MKQHNEMLAKEVRNIRCLLEIRDKTIHERIGENEKLSNQVEELSNTIVELHKANANLVQEKDNLKRTFELLQAESVNKYKVMEEKYSEFLKGKENKKRQLSHCGERLILLWMRKVRFLEISTKQTKHMKIFQKNVYRISIQPYHRIKGLS